MGAHLSKSTLLSHGQDWEVYVLAGWRSERSKELDRIGGECICQCKEQSFLVTVGLWSFAMRAWLMHRIGSRVPSIKHGVDI